VLSRKRFAANVNHLQIQIAIQYKQIRAFTDGDAADVRLDARDARQPAPAAPTPTEPE